MPADDPALRFDVFAEQEQVLDRQGDRTAKAEILRRMAELSDRLGDPDRTFTSLLGQSRQAFETSDYDRAVDLATQAADTARAAGLGARVAEGHLWAGKALTWHGEGAAAQTQLNTALEAARAEGQTALVAEALRYLAMLASNEGRFADALDFGVRAREEFAKDGDLEAESTALAQHAVTLFNLGRVAESRDLFEQVLPVFMASGHLYRQSVALGNLASSSLILGDFAAAERWCEQAIERSQTLGDVEGTATNRTILGLTQLWTNRWAEARESFEYAWRTGQEVGSSLVSLDAALWLGVGMLEYGEATEATLAHARTLAADATVEAAGPQTAAHALLVLAQALLSTGENGRLAEADEAARQAAAVLRDSGVEASIPQCTALRIVIAQCRRSRPDQGGGRGCRPGRGAGSTGHRRLDAVGTPTGPAVGAAGRFTGPRGGAAAAAGGRAGVRRPAPRGRGGSGATGRLPRGPVRRPPGPAPRRALTWTSIWVSPAAGTSPRGSTASCAEAVRDGRLRPGDRLPPTRELAGRLELSRGTVATAYERLVAEGFLVGARRAPAPSWPPTCRTGCREGAGGRVPCDRAGLDGDPDRRCRPDGRAAATTSASASPTRGCSRSTRWRRLVAAELRAGANAPGRYADPAGLPGCGRPIGRYIGVSRGPCAATPRTCWSPTAPSRRSTWSAGCCSSPATSWRSRTRATRRRATLFAAFGCAWRRSRSTRRGWSSTQLPARARLVYVTPSHQFPTGRADVAAAAGRAAGVGRRQHDALVVEDDYDSEFRFSARPLEPLTTSTPAGGCSTSARSPRRCCPRCGSGFLVAPPSLRPRCAPRASCPTATAPVPTQAALARFIDEGLLARHVRKASGVYAARHAAVLAALGRSPASGSCPRRPGCTCAPGCPGLDPATGGESWCAARRVGVAVESLDGYYLGAQGSTSDGTARGRAWWSGYGAVADDRLDEGLRRLVRVLRRETAVS